MSRLTQLSNQVPLRLLLRYVTTIVRYGSPRKYFNAVRALYCFQRAMLVIPTMPLLLKVEISRYCTVNCLYCTATKEKVFFSLDRFKEVVDTVKDYVFMVHLYEVGEPLHHDDVLEFIRYSHANRLATVISSSLSIEKNDSFWRDLAVSGLDRLIVAIDGITEPVYLKYRREGDLNLVMSNLEAILRHRKKEGGKLQVEWQMIDLPWNRCEQEPARQLSKKLGCDVFRIIPDASIRTNYSLEGSVRQHNCLWPYVLLLINAYNDVLPCFKPGINPGVLGSLTQNSLMDIWNAEIIKQIRSRDLICSKEGCRTCRE